VSINGNSGNFIKNRADCGFVTVVIPCYKSAGYLRHTVEEILDTAARHGREDLRILLVDDGSGDDTGDVICDLCRCYENRITGILLAKNGGQTQAKMAVLPFIHGGVTVFMDDDGQHDPGKIFDLEQKVLEGYDIVYAQFPKVEESRMRRAGSRMLNGILTLCTKKPAGLRITSYMAISEAALEELKRYKSRHPFIGGWLCSHGYRAAGIPVPHRKREEGTSRYTVKKLLYRTLELTVLYRIPPGKNDEPRVQFRAVMNAENLSRKADPDAVHGCG